MRYKKGSKVEVLRNEVPSASWRSATIVCRNGTITLYDVHPDVADDQVVGNMSRKSIRPCPPLIDLAEDWVPGDVVELFHNLSWKMATVSKFLGRDQFLVRLFGLSQEFIVRKSDLQLRQSWIDSQWIVIGKGSRSCEVGESYWQSTPNYIQTRGSQVKRIDMAKSFYVKDHSLAVQNNINFKESRVASSRTLKRGVPQCDSQVEPCYRSAKKFRATDKEGTCHRVITGISSSSPEKVEAIASTREMLGEKFIYHSLKNRTIGFSGVDAEEKQNGALWYSHTLSLEPNDADSATCSIGPFEDTEGHYNDAESFCPFGNEKGNFISSPKEELHRLELHAYRCTLEALHASGSLSWEQESLVTNLRISLHISNDEHLMELRKLVSNNGQYQHQIAASRAAYEQPLFAIDSELGRIQTTRSSLELVCTNFELRATLEEERGLEEDEKARLDLAE
ncbi:LOW QUALITY PROTEIN: hypothetical protein RJ639_042500 [Escallonia herrerae]|uniref:ENT domain-containing protein n=1 Tax=Escallonia herrerae TaxID=1293975 RepID=A0AA88WDF4_9ASTE|nr:LOW QUALITY PROTEIN: hypothetical protein RJ639_042500 [Escallonia herrerae]